MKDLLSKPKVQNERGYAITRQMPYTNGYQSVEKFRSSKIYNVCTSS
jgi:hypothetical protein